MTTENRTPVSDAEAEFATKWETGPTRTRWLMLPPQVGDDAPDIRLRDATDESVALSDFWADGPALLLLWRHFGCGCGIARAGSLVEEYDDYTDAGATVVVIGQGDPARAAAYADDHGLPCPVLCDPDFEAYEAYGLPEFVPAQVLYDAPEALRRREPEASAAFFEERREGGRPLVDSPWQSPGEFVVDPDGVLKLTYRYQYCEDFPDPRVLVTAIEAAAERA